MTAADPDLVDTLTGLLAGDFSRLAPRFVGDPPAIVRWIAAFNGAIAVVEDLLARGVAPAGGARTARRAALGGQPRPARRRAPAHPLRRALETRSMYGSIVLAQRCGPRSTSRVRITSRSSRR